MRSRFIIFAHARSGSSSLAHLLNTSSDVDLVFEPFHKNFVSRSPQWRDYSSWIDSPQKMNQAVDELFEEYNAIKDLMYRFDRPIYEALLARQDLKVIFLTRKDLVASAISVQVAKQTDIWQKSDLEARPKAYEQSFDPIDIPEAESMVRYLHNLIAHYRSFLEENRPGEFLNIEYESVYNQDTNRNTQVLQEICDFLQIQLPPNDAVEQYMSPQNARLGADNLYSKVPNYQEVLDYFSKIKL